MKRCVSVRETPPGGSLRQAARALLLRLGVKRFGTPDEGTQAAVEATEDVTRLELLAERVLDTESWAELLAG
jgi:hypothetical protein